MAELSIFLLQPLTIDVLLWLQLTIYIFTSKCGILEEGFVTITDALFEINKKNL